MDASNDELLEDIDSTIDRLVENASAMKQAKINQFFNHEVEAMEKLQESLLARIMHRESLLEKEKVLTSIRQDAVHKKIAEFALNGSRRQKRARSRKGTSTRLSTMLPSTNSPVSLSSKTTDGPFQSLCVIRQQEARLSKWPWAMKDLRSTKSMDVIMKPSTKP